MGTPTYYSGKGSTNTSRIYSKDVESRISTTRETKSRSKSKAKPINKSAMAEMFELLEEVERCRDAVTERQHDLDSAKRDLEIAEQKVSDQIDKFDPETKARLRRMMGTLESKEQDER